MIKGAIRFPLHPLQPHFYITLKKGRVCFFFHSLEYGDFWFSAGGILEGMPWSVGVGIPKENTESPEKTNMTMSKQP